jgi:hypothetical protein
MKAVLERLINSQAPEHTPLPGFDSYNTRSGKASSFEGSLG